MVPVFIVFVTLALLYRLVMWLMSKSEKLEDLLEGKPVVIVEDGQLASGECAKRQYDGV